MVLILSNSDLQAALSMGDCIQALEDAFRDLGMGLATSTPRRDTYVPTSEPGLFYRLNAMEGAIERLRVAAQRINSERIGWRMVNGNMRQVEIPAAPGGRYVGLVYLYSTETLELLAIMNDAQIQRMRVAGVCGVAAKYLACRDSRVLGLFGSGWQAEAQVLAMKAVRPIERVNVFSPMREHREMFAKRMSKMMGLDVIAVGHPSDVPRGCDIVSAATNSREPVCLGAWVPAGAHLTCIGGIDFDESAWDRSDLIVCAGQGFTEKHTMADPSKVPDLSFDHGLVDKHLYRKHLSRIGYLPDLILGRFQGRIDEGQTTLFVKSGNTQGIEFACTAKKAHEEAGRRGLGREVPTDWFLEYEKP